MADNSKETQPMERPFTDHSFELFLSEDKLMGSKCKQCGTQYCPPRALCIACPSEELEWVAMPTEGALAAYTCITVPTPALAAEGYGRDNPVCVGVVELMDGVRVDARIEEVDTKKPESIGIGTKLKVRFKHLEGGTVLAYEPV